MSNVVFRRIHGRIVPIRINREEKQDLAKGTALVAAGAGVGFAAGKVGSKISKSGMRFANRGLSLRVATLRKFNSKPVAELSDIVTKLRRSQIAHDSVELGRKLVKRSAQVMDKGAHAGTILGTVGGGILGNALYKILKRNRKDDASAAAAQTAATAIGASVGYASAIAGKEGFASAARYFAGRIRQAGPGKVLSLLRGVK